MISRKQIRAAYEQASSEFTESREFQLLVSGRADRDPVF